MNENRESSPQVSDLGKLRSIVRPDTLSAIAGWCRPQRPGLVLLCLCNVSYSLLTLGIPLLTRSLVDSAVNRSTALLWRYGLMLGLLIAAERCAAFLISWVGTKVSADLQQNLQRMTLQELFDKEYAGIRPFHSGELVNRVFSDVNVVKNGVTKLLPDLLRILVSFVGAAIILITMDWRFLPVMLICSAAWVGLTLLFRGSMKERHKRMQEAEDAMHAATQESIENIRVIKASGSEARVLAGVGTRADRLRDQQIRNGRLTLMLRNGMGTMFDLSWLLAYLWGCIKIFRGEFTYGSLAALIPLIGRIQGPVANATGLMGQIYGVTASAERLREILDLPADEDRGSLTDFDSILIDHVSFRYEDGTEDVLTDISGQICRGDVIALTGRSGGGKTSLFQLLLGIYRPTRGGILFREDDREVPVSRGTRRLFAYVPQGNTLFSGTLRDNLTRFTEQASEELIMEAVRTACLEELVEEIGLDAVIGERGIGLSEGQAQRVAIARALLSRAPVLLLDEATSALDEETEARLLRNIAALRGERFRVSTIMIVTHRPAALQICSRRWHIEDCRMTE